MGILERNTQKESGGLMFDNILVDLARYTEHVDICSFIRAWMTSVGFRSVCYLRLQNYFYIHRRQFYPFKFMAHYFHGLSIRNFGLDACLGHRIGPGLRIEHPVGIVIGGGVVIGKNATILQGVTIGEKYVDQRSDGKYPFIGDNVVIGVNSVILGGIRIGSDVAFGANSLVLADVEDNISIFGIHGKRGKNL